MLLALISLVGAAMATRVCIASHDQLGLPTCTNSCLTTDTSILDGVCADNIKGICELDGGVASFFRVYSRCLALSCQEDADRTSFIAIFQTQCGWYPYITDEQASYFGDWQVYLQGSSTPVPFPSTSAAESTVTMNGGAIAYSSDVSTEQPQSTTPAQTTTGPSRSPTKTPQSTTDVSATPKSTTVGNVNSQTSSSALSYSSTSSAPVTRETPMSPAAIAGVAVASIVILGSVVLAAFFLSRRFQRRHLGRSAHTPPPLVHESNTGRHPHEKAELDAQHSEVGFGAPVGHAELDGGSPVSPVWEPVHVRGSERAKIAQNF